MDPLTVLRSLADDWRSEAELLRHRGAPRQADTLKSAADDLETRLREWELELLTLEEAAEEAGLAYDTVQRKVAQGEIPNAGEKNAPRVPRAALYPWIETPEPELYEDPVEDLAHRTLQARES